MLDNFYLGNEKLNLCQISWPETCLSDFCVLFLCSSSQLLESLPLPNVRIFIYIFNQFEIILNASLG